MEEKKILNIINEDGTQEEVELVIAVEFDDDNKDYVIYTKNEEEKNDDNKPTLIKLYCASLDRSDDGAKLYGIHSDEDWSKLKDDVLRKLAQKDQKTEDYNFKQIVLNEVIGNQVDDLPRQIREKKEESYAYTLENRKNVPIKIEEKKAEVDLPITENENNISNETEKIDEKTKADDIIKLVFDSIDESGREYDVNTPITTEEAKIEENNVSESIPMVTSISTAPVSIDNVVGIDDVMSLTDKLNKALEEENQEKIRAEETRVRYEETIEGLKIITQKYNDSLKNVKNSIQRSIDESVERKNRYSKIASDNDKKIADTIKETASLKEKISYIESLEDWKREENQESDFQTLKKVA